MKIDALRRVPLLSTLNVHELSSLSTFATDRSFSPGQTLVEQDESAGSLFVIVRGRAKVTRTSAAGLEVILAIRGVGECIGELSVLDGAPRSASVVAMTDLNALEISSRAMQDALASNPKLASALLSAVVKRLRQASDTIEDLATKSLTQRLAVVLGSLANQYGSDTKSGRKLPHPLTTSDLAGLVGTNRDEANRALSSLRKRGFVTRDSSDKGLIVIDSAGLRDFADYR